MSDQLFSVENKICIVTGGLGPVSYTHLTLPTIA